MKRATYHHGDLREALVVAAEKLVAAKGVAARSGGEVGDGAIRPSRADRERALDALLDALLRAVSE